MRKLTIILLTFLTVIASAQDRQDAAPVSLSAKSQDITTALYWQQDNGRWVSRKNTKLPYLGEGVAVPNFRQIFLGECEGRTFLFIDYWKYYWEYPALKEQWMRTTTIYQALLSPEDVIRLDSLSVGEQYSVTPRFQTDMSKDRRDYSFSFFLSLTNTLLSAASDDDAAKLPCLTVKRFVGKDGKDVVRFSLLNEAAVGLIDSFYFETDYKTYRRLFTPDKTTDHR